MAIDASIYGLLKQQEAPDILGSANKAMNLKSLAMQQDKAGLENEAAQRQAHLEKAATYGSALEGLAAVPAEQRPQAYAQVRAEMLKSGVVTPDRMPEQYDPQLHQVELARYQQSAPALKAQLERSQIALHKSQATENYAQAKKAEADSLRERLEKDPSKMNPAQRLGKMGTEGKQKIGFLTSGLEGLTRYEDAYNKGGRQSYINPQTPLIGGMVSSTPIDEARVGLEEAIGRLASGGAINSGEEARFRKMIPTAADNDDAAQRKLVNLRKDMENKLTAYGFKSSELGDLGFDPQTLGYGAPKEKEAPATSGGMVKEAVAAPPKPKNGTEMDGYVFLGGDPANPKSWKKAR